MPKTAGKLLEVQATGTNTGTWGDVLNLQTIDIVDQNMGGLTEKTLASSNVTLSASEAANAILRLTGSLGAHVQVTSANVGFYLVENLTSGAFNVTLTNGVAGVVIPQNARAIVCADLSNGVAIFGLASITNPNVIETGTAMLFFSAVPTGWSLSGALNDYGIRLVNSTGGGTVGSVAYSTVFGKTATDPYTLLVADIPLHTHTFNIPTAGNRSFPESVTTAQWNASLENARPGIFTLTSSSAGSGGGHTQPIDMRVQSVTTVVATRAA